MCDERLYNFNSFIEKTVRIIKSERENNVKEDTFDNDYMTGEITYKYYNDMMWPERFAKCVSVDEAIGLLERVYQLEI